MDFSPDTLKFYSSVKVAATLFCHQDLLGQEQLHLVGWIQVQDSVTQLVQSLQLPKSIEESVQELIQPIGDQIRRWLSKHSYVLGDRVDLYNKFSWTSHGMINYQKTAENLIESRQLGKLNEFTLAFVDSFDYISFVTDDSNEFEKLLVEQVLPIIKSDIYAFSNCRLIFSYLFRDKFPYLFREYVTDSFLVTEFSEKGFKGAASSGNTSLTQYFITKIEPHKKALLVKDQVLHILKSKNRFVNLDTLLFLLSQMDVHQMNELFIENTKHVLLRFLEWPLQRHFMKLTNKLWNAMSPEAFNSILQAIVQHIIQHQSISNNPFGYTSIFRDFWLNSPSEYRIICMKEFIFLIISNLFDPHDYFNAVSSLFRDESYHEKLEALFFSNADAVLEIILNENKAKAFESIVQKFFSPDDFSLDFAEKYGVFTKKYLEIYYGEVDIAD